MINNPRSHNLDEILAGYVLGDLDEVELVWLNEQLAANPQLREQVAQLESTLNLLPYGLPEDVPQNNLRSQILAQAKLKPVSPKFRWGWIISAVTAVGTLFLAINNFSLRQQIAFTENRLQQQQELITLLRQPNNRLVALTANDDVVTASGSLFISPESNTAVLTLKNLDALPGKQVYRLWAVSQGQKIGCSNFTPNAQGEVHLNLSSDDVLFNASSISITIEPEPDTEQPLGREFLSGSYAEI
ncbi:anti-sigma factor [Pleurocapsa sp. PCC 7319]|uniref:anti-sigma factor n=1 Tax=Pleurocapsa sp. PCC 7319 TaxID=118161 RepID=UPI000346D464|nr:anti-sigma factor [Pleurocapsa sp. PCC 7319]